MSAHSMMCITLAVVGMATPRLAAQVTNVTQSTNHTTIQDAVDAADDGDEIVVAPGTYVGTTHFNAGWEGWLHSSGGPDVTTLRVTNSVLPVFEMSGGQGPDLVIEGFEFDRTTPLGGMVGGGGARISQSSPRFVDCVFSLLVASKGGAVRAYNGSVPTFEGCTFVGCISTVDDGGAAHLENGGTFINCNFLGCDAERDGGAVYAEGDVSFSGCEFVENTSQRWGGAVLAKGDVRLTSCAVTENTALDGAGGAVRVEDGDLLLTSCTFIDNEAQVPGSHLGGPGGAVWQGNGGDVEIVNCTFAGNLGQPGGAVYTNADEVLVQDTTFLSNTSGDGGGLWAEADVIDLIDSTFVENIGTSEGGGAWLHASGPATVVRCNFDSNHAGRPAWGSPGIGGGLWIEAGASLVTDCDFVENLSVGLDIFKPGRGGGLYARGGGVVQRCRFLRNVATSFVDEVFNVWGKTAAFELDDSWIVDGCLVAGNITEGTPLLSTCADLEAGIVRNTTFVSNPFGAGLSSNGDLLVENCIFVDDPAAHTGTSNYCLFDDAGPPATGTGNLYSSDPLFVDSLGPDGMPGTGDEDYRLQATSPCIDAGTNDLSPDAGDLDCDGNTSEPVPLDLDGFVRRVDDPATTDTGSGTAPIVDMGPYEFLSHAPDSGLIATLPPASGWGPAPGAGAGALAGGVAAATTLVEPFPCDPPAAAMATSPCLPDLGMGAPGGPRLTICRLGPTRRDAVLEARVLGAAPGASVVLVAGLRPVGEPTRDQDVLVLAIVRADDRGGARVLLGPGRVGAGPVFVRAVAGAASEPQWGNVVQLVDADG